MLAEIFINIAPYLSLFSVILAIFAMIQARKQTSELSYLLQSFKASTSQQAQKFTTVLDIIVENLSTKQVGEFPIYCGEIVKIIKQAKKSIDIICDVPGYGILSSPATWVDYKTELIRKINHPSVRVRMTTLSLDERVDIYNRNPPTNTEELQIALKNSQFKTNLTSFSQRYMNNKAIDEISYEEFEKAHRDEQNQCLFNDFRHAHRGELYSVREMPIFCWIVDSKIAVFTIRVLTDNDRIEHGFLTSDSKIIESLVKYFESRITKTIT